MTAHFRALLRRRKEEFIIAAVLIVAFTALLWPALRFVSREAKAFLAERNSAAVQAGFRAERDSALKNVRAIIASGSLPRYLEANDRNSALSIIKAEAQQRELGFVVAVNRDGVALARTPAVSSYGDYVLETQPWGRAAAQGREVTMIGPGRNFPLIMSAAAPILEEGEVAGAVFGGYWLDDQYAHRFRSQYLSRYLTDQTHLVFYSTAAGVTGTSFDDPELSKLARNYFRQGSDWVQKGDSDAEIKMRDDNYLLVNIRFPDPADPERAVGGGMIVLVPITYIHEAAVPAAGLAALAFLATAYFTYRHRRNAKTKRWFLAAAACLALFLATFGVSKFLLEREALRVHAPLPTIYNSTMALVPDFNMIGLGTPQRVAIHVKTGGEAINAAQAVIRFDPQAVKVVDILTVNSFCQTGFFAEREIDQAAGEARIACGVPNPGFSQETGTLAELLIEPLQAGRFSLTFAAGTKVLANDGLGTNVLRAATNGSYLATGFSRASAAGAPGPLPVFSPTHSNSERWYNSKRVVFHWPRLSGDDQSYVYALDAVSSTVPIGQFTRASSLVLNVLNDGTHYFHVATVNGGVHGPASHFKFQVDTNPPEPPVIRASETEVRPGAIVRFELMSHDDESGLQETYYVNIDDSIFLPTLPVFNMPLLQEGAHSVVARVFDNAGNFSDSEIEIRVVK